MAEVRKVQGEVEARGLLGEWRRSGRNMSEWCRQQGVSAHSLAWWKRHLEGGGIRVVEVTPATPAVTRPTARYILHLDDLSIEVSDDFQEETLSRLLGLVVPC